MLERNLLPCPFCGGEAHVACYYPATEQQFYVVECGDCGIQSLPDEPAALVTFWNNRTAS